MPSSVQAGAACAVDWEKFFRIQFQPKVRGTIKYLPSKENSMTSKCVSGVLMFALVVALATPARADSLKTRGNEIVAGIAGVVAAIVVVVVIVAVHYSKKRSVTGCVSSGANGITITDEKDKQVYALSGNTTDIKPGDRIKLHGKKAKPTGTDKTLVWEAKEVTKDFGVCQP